MLHSIRRGPERTASDVVDKLLACHERILRFLGIAQRLVDAAALGASPAEIEGAAGELVRYFDESLPLHQLDEDESIVPHLTAHHATHPSSELEDALATMKSEHRDFEKTLAQLLDHWRAVRDSAAALQSRAREMRELTARLDQSMRHHLALEESVIFPKLRALPAEAKDAIGHEMAKRRAARHDYS